MKYIGGKQRLSKDIVSIINEYRKDDNQPYIEAFCGSCAVGRKLTGNRIFNDIHYKLIELYKAIINGDYIPPDFMTRERYYYLKNTKDLTLNDYYESIFASFFCSFGGKEWGGFAKDKNDKRNYCLEGKKDIMRLGNDLKNSQLISVDYKTLPSIYNFDNIIIYCDPPYEHSQKYKGINFNHNEFWDTVSVWAKNNIVLVSERTIKANHQILKTFNLKTTLSRSNYKTHQEYLVLVKDK